MSSTGEDLDLLLSLGQEEKVVETPPGSPPPFPSYLSDDDKSPKNSNPRSNNMSVFRDAVKDYLEPQPSSIHAAPHSTSKTSRNSSQIDVEKYSGLRIKNRLISAFELNNRFSEIRFVRLPVIRNLIVGDTLSGCWATVGVLTEKGSSKVSSTGKSFCVWKMSCLDETTVSLFLFGDAYTSNCNEKVGAVFALFNSSVRKDASSGFSLSVYSASNILKLGTSVDYGVCKGKRKDGVACTMIINRRLGAYCKYHSSRPSQTQRYSTSRAELKGGNIGMSFRRQPEGIYMVDPLAGGSKLRKTVQRVKVLSVDGLKKALSKAESVTTNGHSQGIRFLSEVAANGVDSKLASKISAKPNQAKNTAGFIRPISATVASSKIQRENKVPESKRKKTHHDSTKMIELDIVSSDEEGR